MLYPPALPRWYKNRTTELKFVVQVTSYVLFSRRIIGYVAGKVKEPFGEDMGNVLNWPTPSGYECAPWRNVRSDAMRMRRRIFA